MVDVREFLRTHSVEELNRSAEEYFAKTSDWTYLLAKPFAAPAECANLLIEFWATLQGLDVCATMDVLDFGPGSCWTSHFLTQMGCKVYACDVSASALEIGKARYQQHPPFGKHLPPEFLVYDGFRFPLADKTIDRALCMHALHHVPNPSQVLAEMSRVLRPGGVAAFAEPGPEHSKDPVSQRELEAGVLENDIVMEDILKWASAAGFQRLDLTVFPIARTALTLENYDRFVAGDPQIGQRVLDPVRQHAAATRTFFLYKEATPSLWSASISGLGAELSVRISGRAFHTGLAIPAEVTVRNTGSATWLQAGMGAGSVNLGYHLKNLATGEYLLDYGRSPLEPSGRPVRPAESLSLQLAIPAPPPGAYELTFDLVSELVCWFADQDRSQTVSFRIEVT